MGTPEFAVAVYIGAKPDFKYPPLGLKTWSAFKAEALYEPSEYERVRERLLDGRMWVIHEPGFIRTIVGIIEGSEPAIYLANATRLALEVQGIDYTGG